MFQSLQLCTIMPHIIQLLECFKDCANHCDDDCGNDCGDYFARVCGDQCDYDDAEVCANDRGKDCANYCGVEFLKKENAEPRNPDPLYFDQLWGHVTVNNRTMTDYDAI